MTRPDPSLPPHIRILIALHEAPDSGWPTTEMTVSRLLHVLQHALGRDQYGKSRNGRGDYRNHFCAGDGSADFGTCREAVAQGLMVEHPPRAISGGDHIFTVTVAGKAHVVANSLPEPKLTRGQRRYREWLGSAAADCGVTFGEWLRARTARRDSDAGEA